MSTPVSLKAQLHRLIDEMTTDEAEGLLDYLNMLADPDELTPAEEERVQRGRDQTARGEHVTGAQFRAKYGL